MNSIKNLERLQKLHLLIENEQTGPPKELARQLHISERLVYCLMEQLKDLEAKICYNRSRRTYYYGNDFRVDLNVSFSVTLEDETIQLYKGSYL